MLGFGLTGSIISVGLLFCTILRPRVLLSIPVAFAGLAGVGLSWEVAGAWAWAVSRSAERARLLATGSSVFIKWVDYS